MDENTGLKDDASGESVTKPDVLLDKLFDPEDLKILQSGEITKISLGNRGVRDAGCINAFGNQIRELIAGNQCRTLIFDLQGVWFLPSRTLGEFLSLSQKVERIELQNVSEEIQEAIRVTQLDQLLHVTTTPENLA